VSQGTLSSAASVRLETNFSRSYAAVAAVLHVEVIANAIFQVPFLEFGNWWVVFYVTVPVIGMNIWAWLRGSLGFWSYLHGAAVLLALWQWQYLVVDPALLPENFQAWVWWLVGMATISIGVSKPLWLGAVYLVVASASWYLVDTSIAGGSGDPAIALQNAVYVFLLGGAVSSLIWLTRDGAKRADEANSTAIASAIEEAQIDAVERERQRIDALVHDQVLNTLLVAANAKTDLEQHAVANMASEAIASLESAANDQELSSRVTTLGLYRSLRKAAFRASREIEVEILSAGLEEIPAEIAQAVTQAALQAIDNAISHSMAERIQLRLGSSTFKGLMVEVRDNGKGFIPEPLPKDRLGISTSIKARMDLVGGKAQVSSTPGKGTTVILSWSK
jgi:signal transduction histidine kinase